MKQRHTVYLGIGSNMGERRENILTAIRLLQGRGEIEVDQLSSLHETKPVGGPAQGDFLNGALRILTTLSPEHLLRELKSIERRMGRIKTVADGPRPIDLDILFYDDVEIHSEELTVPHPRLFSREFVLTPLKELMPSEQWKRRVLPKIAEGR